MPNVNNDGVKLHYETTGSGPVVILQHGFTSALDRWHLSGVVDALKDDYHLVLLDARGHGMSDKPHSPEDYKWERRASDVIAVADDIGVDQFSFWGYSMGAMYAYWVSHYFPERTSKLIIGGIDPYTAEQDDKFRNMDGLNPDRFIAQFERGLGTTFPPAARDRMLNNDLLALAAAMDAPLHENVALSAIPASIGCRCLVYCALDDKFYDGAKTSADEIEKSMFVELPDMNHLMAAMNNDAILPYVVDFLSDQ